MDSNLKFKLFLIDQHIHNINIMFSLLIHLFLNYPIKEELQRFIIFQRMKVRKMKFL